MNNKSVTQKSWTQRNWTWTLPVFGVVLLGGFLLVSLTGDLLGDFGQAYTDSQLFQGAIDNAQQNEAVKTALGNLEPVDKMAVLEGDVGYSNQNNHVAFSVRVKGSGGKAMMDVKADRVKSVWDYKKITIRIKNPPEKRQTIEVLE